MTERGKSLSVLTVNTLAFTVCFACWMMNGVLVTFLVDNGLYNWDKAQIGWLIGIPVLTGSLIRLPLGILTDKYGGRIVYALLMLVSAIPMYLMSEARSFSDFVWGSLGFGLAGGSFSVGIAYTSVWFSKERQGTVLGIFGIGNAGSALTSLGAPLLLKYLTDGGANMEGWRNLPKIYAAGLVVITVLFILLTYHRKTLHGKEKTILQQLAPLKHMRVWRFGLYYFLVFGGFVALAQWLIPYYVNVYTMSIVMAGMMASIFSLPSGIIRALGGWLSDKMGARHVMYWVLGSCLVCSALLIVPRMNIYSPGGGVMALASGTVTEVTDREIVVSGIVTKKYSYQPKAADSGIGMAGQDEGMRVFPTAEFQQEPAVKVGDTVKKKQLLVRGVTHIYFQANVWIFTFLVFVIGIMMGIGKAAVYKHIPDYFPQEVGVVGGIVGVIGGLGGFICPIVFGYLLQLTGIWTTCWMFFTVLSLVSLLWMHRVIRRMEKEKAPPLGPEIFEVQNSFSHKPVTEGASFEPLPAPVLGKV